MALKVRSAAEATEEWLRAAPLSLPKYKRGITSPKRPWQESTLASEDIYEDEVQKAIAAKRFGKGVGGSSNAEHQAMSLSKGAANYPGGIRAGKTKYNRKITPVLAYMSNIDLPPPGGRGSPENIARSSAFQTQMAKYRTG